MNLRSIRALGALCFLFVLCAAVPLQALENAPDHYLCYKATSTLNKHRLALSKVRVDIQDRFGGPQRLAVKRIDTLCNPAGVHQSAVSYPAIHLESLVLKALKGAPKFVPSTQGVTDQFGTRTLALTALAGVLDVTPAHSGLNAPADFSDDPTKSAAEINRFKCYKAGIPKGAPKFVSPPSPSVTDEIFSNGQSFLVKKISKVCYPADVEGATPEAVTRSTLLVCYGVKRLKGAKFSHDTLGTRTRTAGVRIVRRGSPIELCVTARVFPGS